MTSKVSIFAHHHQSFVESIFQVLGKGRQHAAAIYEDIMRKGIPSAAHPVFKNAPQLYAQILQMTDQGLPEIVGERHDGTTGKFLLRTHDKLEVESVLIPMQSGGTLCIS